jgi:hypothetical protein
VVYFKISYLGRKEEREIGENVVSGEKYSRNYKSSCFRANSYAVCEEKGEGEWIKGHLYF